MAGLAMLGLACASCSDDSGDDDKGNACSASVCLNGQLTACVNGVASAPVTCPNGCNAEGNACAEASPTTCTEGAKQCSGNLLQVCANNAWTTSETCANGCENNACKPSASTTCTEGAKQCSGNLLHVCANNAWTTSETCVNGCENNACKPSASTTCTEGAKQCSGNLLQVCANNAWTTSETCANGCENNACKSSSSSGGGDAEGDGCDYDTFSEYCNGSTLVYCADDNTIVMEDCSEYSAECHAIADFYGDGINGATCYGSEDFCTTKGDTRNMCVDYWEFSYYGEQTCTTTIDGALVWEFFDDWNGDVCEGWCLEDGSGCE